MDSPRILAVATATPPRPFRQEEILALSGYADVRRRHFFAASEIETRHLAIDPATFDPTESLDALNARFAEFGPALGTRRPHRHWSGRGSSRARWTSSLRRPAPAGSARAWTTRELAAVQRAAILKGEAGIGGKPVKDLPLDKAVEFFLELHESNVKPRTRQRYEGSLWRLAAAFPGQKVLSLSPVSLERYKRERLARGAKPATVNRDLEVLRNCCNHLVAKGS